MQFTTLAVFALAAVASVHGAPLHKRIAQVISDSTPKWEQACNAAGGGTQCNQVAVASFSTLLAAPGPCAQQNAADNMVDLAKTLNTNADMIKFAQIFAQQPRNSPTSQSVPYCQSAPRNAELNGLFQCQFQGDDPKTFVGGTAVGGNGTIPFGMSAPVNPAGSCLANPSGPIADGSQLVDITQSPGVGGTTSSDTTTGGSNSTSTVATPSATPSGSSDTDCEEDPTESTSTASLTMPATAVSAATPSATSGNFKLTNGQNAQKLNAQFATLTATSPCTEGTNACVNGAFAQCVGGQYVTQSCGSSLTCAALPLVNSAGTSITCTTNADALARIAATGAQGGLTGSG
ncbi:uncharacterized protein EDB91DRAFT_866006 [Suillus paluster]|uniref:uncharacterized protein n=1 Tax=Suillus paluster TaxID=48578 RepID=UPI001B87EEFC|nr:uncharacterized protein EDB91DRAFT_866006 [Suillus paluster]KAG1728159.1 hypothetical protein EDB91DRAFT_866006 [Suillus paluster]